MELLAQTSKPPLLILFVLNGSKIKVDVKWGEKTALVVKSPQNFSLSSESAIVKFIALNKGLNWLGNDADEEAEVGHWVRFSHGQLSCASDYSDAVAYLDKKIQPVTYFVGNHLTLADLAVFSVLIKSKDWNNSEKPTNLMRWFKMISDLDFVRSTIESLPDCVKLIKKEGRKEEGKFVDLPDAEMGKVIVRFPPEASGYLHIGHAKAALLNQYYKEAFDGKLIMRFDDTNPAKEKVDFEKVILEDLKLLKIPYDIFSHTSDHFDYILTLCEKLLKEGKAYVDDTEPEQMKNEREQKVESKNRSNDVDKNFKMWKEMLNGTEYGQKCCVRAKIDMSSLNGCMRDPTIYRCKNEPHPKTGTKYKVYPTYDFACPIVDSIEGVTHCLRTMEYHDRDEQFFWFIDALGLRKPHIWEYSRLNMVNTVLSKRKLTWFVDNKYVDGWDDPRMPTVRGILRRGMTVEGLKQFIISQGSSRSVVVMEWDKIWAINKKVIDPIAPRYTAVSKDNVIVHIEGVKEEPLTVPKHPKNPEVGNKTVWVAPQVLIDQADADLLKEGENVTFINWGNILINKITRENGKVVSIEATPNLEDKNYKKTMKITFLAKTDKAPLIPCYCLYFDHIISKAILGKDEDFKDYINKNTLSVVETFVDPELASLKQFDIIQIQRKGFFICDRVYQPLSENIGQETPLAIIFIPDGHTKEMPTSVAPSKSIEKEKKVDGNQVANIASSIQCQGDLVRDLKAKKAGKDQIKTEVDKLLALKAEYKKLTGNDYQPGAVPASVNAANKPGEVDEITNKIILQGDLVRDLKAKKAGKDEIKAEVDKLLALKGDYKKLTGKDYQPGAAPSTPKVNVTNNQGEVDEITKKIILQGDLVRDLKAKKAGKDEIKAQVDKLLTLKGDYKKLTGKDYQPGAAPATPNINVASNQVDDVANRIKTQGDLVRDLKAKKAGKDEIKTEVDKLLALKAEYKKLTGHDFQPGAPTAKPAEKTADNKVVEITEKVKQQGDVVRDLKAKKASKDEIKVEVDKLLALKAEYKQLTGNDFPAQPPQKADKQSAAPVKDQVGDNKVTEITNKVKQQGDLVRDLKAKKASKDEIKNEVDKLLALKAEYKQLTGNDFPAQPTPVKVESNDVLNLTNDVKKQGDIVRDLKAKKAGKNDIDAAVKLLLELKSKYKELTGNDFPAEGRQKKQDAKPKAPEGKAAKPEKPKDKKQNDDSALKKVTRLGLEAEKEVDLPEWYSQVLTKGELIEYYDVSGCYILRPWSFAIWENIKDWFDAEIKKMGVKNCYFPIFVSRSVLEKEKTHIADFAPEVAWVTKSGDSDLAEPIAVRPTSETVMYPAYAKWIQSYRDLPIKLNQWNNVVRWEFKHPQPFLRTREFLWQEGHTAFASAQEAEEEVTKILDLYAQIYTDLLAIPVVKGRKTEKEKFAGGDFTLTAEAFISASGRAIQGATSHHLGQNFSKMFEIIYEDPVTHEKKFVFQNSWGITTRTIGVMIMVHADNQGLVLPPRVASLQIVIVPCGITAGLAESEVEKLHQACEKLKNDLVAVGVRAETDLRSNYSPGWKYNHWELKGVPIRVEIGPKDLQKGEIVAVRRDNGGKTSIKSAGAVASLKSLLDTIQSDLLNKATQELHNHMFLSKDWKSFCQLLDEKNIIQAPFCGEIDCEDNIKNDSARNEDVDSNAPSMGAKSLCIPFSPLAQNSPNDKCIHPKCNRKSKYITLFGRSY